MSRFLSLGLILILMSLCLTSRFLMSLFPPSLCLTSRFLNQVQIQIQNLILRLGSESGTVPHLLKMLLRWLMKQVVGYQQRLRSPKKEVQQVLLSPESPKVLVLA